MLQLQAASSIPLEHEHVVEGVIYGRAYISVPLEREHVVEGVIYGQACGLCRRSRGQTGWLAHWICMTRTVQWSDGSDGLEHKDSAVVRCLARSGSFLPTSYGVQYDAVYGLRVDDTLIWPTAVIIMIVIMIHM